MEVGSGVHEKIKSVSVPNHIFLKDKMEITKTLNEYQIECLLIALEFFFENCEFNDEESDKVLLETLRIQAILQSSVQTIKSNKTPYLN